MQSVYTKIICETNVLMNGEWLKKEEALWYVHVMEYCYVERKKKITETGEGLYELIRNEIRPKEQYRVAKTL